MDKGEVNALISLLDDPDEEIYSQIKNKILSLGHDVIPFLEGAWETSFDSTLQNRIEFLIHQIQFDNIKKELHDWYVSGARDLLEGVIIIAKYQYPDLDGNKIAAQVDSIRQDVWLELNGNLTALEKVRVINHILFDVHGFSGNTTNYHAPQNSFINTVLESKRGNPLSLSIIYTIIAQSLKIPVFGVNLPEHFVLAYVENSNYLNILEGNPKDQILFYVNAFSKGSVFSRKEIETFLKQLKLEPHNNFFEPCSNIDIMRRLIRNLIFSFDKLGYPDKSTEMEQLIQTFSS